MWRAAATRRASAAAHTANGTGWSAGIGGVDFADRNSINADAYLLNIANDSTAEAIATATATAAEAIKITAITFDALGAPNGFRHVLDMAEAVAFTGVVVIDFEVRGFCDYGIV